MPTLQLKIAPAQPPQRHALLATALTQLTARILGKRAEVTAVLVEDLPPARWFIGAQEVEQPTALLEIGITAGTNTAAEKAAFIAAAHAELQRQLAPDGRLAQASYIVVRELPATDWGYDGRTQHARQQERERAAA
jgi:4-oxalocrotonate tautomerase